MPVCKRINICPFFNSMMAKAPEAAAKVKKYYCHGNYLKCARYIHLQITGSAPDDLSPNDMQRVSDIFGWSLGKSAKGQ